MIRDLEDKTALITGAVNGIGRALAIGFAAEGIRVVVADIDEAGTKETVAGIGADAVARRVDVADAESVAALADGSFAEFGHVDLLVNNAGVFQGGLSWERSIEADRNFKLRFPHHR